MNVDAYIEALLFVKSGSMKKSSVMKTLGIDEPTFLSGLESLRNRLQNGGIQLVETESEIQLMTSPELSDFVEALQREDLKKDIGKAGAETLAIVLYRGPVSRAEIDSIRGVNSATMIRNLMVRGLIERQSSQVGGGYSFVASTDLLAHLGVSKKEDLPEYSSVLDQLEVFEQNISESE